MTDDAGVATADFLSPRNPGGLAYPGDFGSPHRGVLDLETAFVNPNARGGTLTNYPNPFHPGEAPTTIAYVLDDNARVTLKVYTLSGDLVLMREFPTGSPGATVGSERVRLGWKERRRKDGGFSGAYILTVNAEGSGETLHAMRRKIAVVR